VLKRAAYLLVVLAAMLPVSLSATALVVFRQPGRIILAGDSVFTVADGTTYRACKVRRAGRWWFVVGGFINHGRETDTYTLVSTAISGTDSVSAALTAIGGLSRTFYDGLKAAQSSPRSDLPMLEIIVGGNDHGVLTVGAYNVELKRREPFELSATSGTCPGEWCADGRVFFSASVDADKPAIRLMSMKPRPAWLQRGDAVAARRLIELQIAATPQSVGPPIDVLEITSSGARWVGRETASQCPF
jgi:hypothetical protein